MHSTAKINAFLEEMDAAPAPNPETLCQHCGVFERRFAHPESQCPPCEQMENLGYQLGAAFRDAATVDELLPDALSSHWYAPEHRAMFERGLRKAFSLSLDQPEARELLLRHPSRIEHDRIPPAPNWEGETDEFREFLDDASFDAFGARAIVGIQHKDAEGLVHLAPEHSQIVVEIASELGMDIDEVIAWAVVLLQRYAQAGGEP